METIQDNGVTLVKATALAKKYRYTTDYIGQLCRSGKIEAKLIGRAWFVNEKSLNDHKTERYGTTRSSEIVINKAVVSDREVNAGPMRREVRPVLSKATHRAFSNELQPTTYNFATKGADRISTYHGDERHLEPVAEKKHFISHPPIHRVEEISHKINVSLEEKASRKLQFEDLPEVSLRGDLKIASLDEPEFFEEVEPVRLENIQFSPESIVKPKVLVTKRYQSTPKLPKLAPQSHRVAISVSEEVIAPIETVVAEPQVRAVRVSAQETMVEIRPVRFVVVPILVSSAMAVCVLILGLASYAETDGLQLQQSLAFSMASVIESVAKIQESY